MPDKAMTSVRAMAFDAVNRATITSDGRFVLFAMMQEGREVTIGLPEEQLWSFMALASLAATRINQLRNADPLPSRHVFLCEGASCRIAPSNETIVDLEIPGGMKLSFALSARASQQLRSMFRGDERRPEDASSLPDQFDFNPLSGVAA